MTAPGMPTGTSAPDVRIRDSVPGELAGIAAIYRAAFPAEDLLPLLAVLLDEGEADSRGIRSRLAIVGDVAVGHAALTPCTVVGDGGRTAPGGGGGEVALFGPLAVAPEWQGRGIGARLVRDCLERAAEAGAARVLVLGDPAYYGRFGFAPEARIAPPYPLPAEWRTAWQSVAVAGPAAPGGGDNPTVAGTLVVPAPWRRPELWLP
jgi:putative acetyltransferase